MSIPGFTAEASLHTTFNIYQIVKNFEQNRAIIPSITQRDLDALHQAMARCMWLIGDPDFCSRLGGMRMM
jgi:hypothetical protein